ncbi:hypothetical protein ACFL27_10000 [candidate division CSSED10-310 bacterium]|uniref:Uncharacterized protein n=1 Tax=candidate division CSSED10-310 bacterium TaxID=2855610 RepID=A0ABV6YWC9_UNCC1
MKEGYWFKSDLFQINKGEDKETNPGCYGKELGDWIGAKFRELGYEVEELIAEDWGWCVICERNEFILWIGCGAVVDMKEYDPESPPDVKNVVWHVFPAIEIPFFYLKSLFKKWLGKLDTGQPLRKLDDELKGILNTEPGIELCEEP